MDVMDRHGLDALVATLPENVQYLSDYGQSHLYSLAVVGIAAAILPRDEAKEATLILVDFETPTLLESPTWMPRVVMMEGLTSHIPPDAALSQRERAVVEYWDSLRKNGTHQNRQTLIARVLREQGLDRGKLAFDDPRVMLELRSSELPDADLREAVNVFREIRVIKTAEEVSLLKRASQINEASLLAAINLAVEGTPIRDLKRCWKTAMVAQDAVGIEIPLAGFDRPWQMAADDGYRLKEGDHLNIDVAGTFEHYWGDTGRTVCIGRPSDRVAELVGCLQETHEVARSMLTPGVSTGAIVEEAANAARGRLDVGFYPVVHSIGIEVYDQPATFGSLYSDSFDVEEGMVLNYESLYFEWPWGALQLEHTYHVGREAPERISTLPDGPLYVER